MKKLFATLLLGASLFANQTLATVDGETITEKDIAIALQAANVNYNSLSESDKSKILDEYIDNVLLSKYALKSGVEKTKEFQETLEKVKQNIALQVWQQQEIKKIEISDKEAKAYYEQNKSMFKQSESVHARHILVKTEDEAKAIIKELGKAKNLKDTFIELAKTKSVGPSGVNGGDLGFFTRETMVKEFSDAAYKLNVGEITSTPVKTQYGYHVIFLEEKRAAGTVDFAQVAPQIKQQLTLQKFKTIIKQKATGLRKNAKIQKL